MAVVRRIDIGRVGKVNPRGASKIEGTKEWAPEGSTDEDRTSFLGKGLTDNKRGKYGIGNI